jgi:hypothetical protein
MKTPCVADRFRKACAVLGMGFVAVACLLGRPERAGAGAPSVLTSVIALQQPPSSLVTNALGSVTVKRGITNQEFDVVVQNIVPSSPDTPVGGLGVFVGDSVGSSNVYFVNVMTGPGTNGTWKLDLKSGPGAPPQLGLSDVTNLVGRFVVIADAATNVYLETIVPRLVLLPASLSYTHRADLVRPGDAPSPNAKGQIIVKLNGKRGTSVLEVKARRLDVGDGYCAYVLPFIGAAVELCVPMTNSVDGAALWLGDTSQGQQLYNGAIEVDHVVRVDQLSGKVIEIQDAFGATHLEGTIP